jgi:hypothetical protein
MTRWTWTTADGAVHELGGVVAWSSGMYVLDEGTSGQLAPGYEFATQAFAGVDGEQLQQITPQPAQPVLGIDVAVTDAAALRARLRTLTHAMRPRRGIGTLTAVGDDGTTRTLPCYYRKGLEAGTVRANRYRTALEFWSPHPWWRGTPLQVPPWSLAAPRPFFPIFPLTLSATTIEGARTIDLSDTDAPTYPRWTVTGPGSQLTLSNTHAARQADGTWADVTDTLVLNAPIGDGQQVVIDTRPGRQSVRRTTGESLFGSLGSDPALWALVDGVNEVTALLTGAGPASRIELAGDRLYSGAL